MTEHGELSHRVVLTTPDLAAAGQAVTALTEAGIEGRHIRVFHQQLPGGVDADQAPEHFGRLTSPWLWARKGGLYALPLGLLLWATGFHWLWLPGVVAIGAVWGWFARFYLDLFQGDQTDKLEELGIPKEDAPFWQTHITDGGTLLVVTLPAAQVPVAVDALEHAGFADRRIYLP
ncbi:MAG: hypothetical protein ACLFRB_07995 [Thiohalorhabdus sp.]|uniref:hypothetical protein n=1 Tax=Thiohalorhabdus sp. TaxID=3094134 RepID=UPI00397EC1E0